MIIESTQKSITDFFHELHRSLVLHAMVRKFIGNLYTILHLKFVANIQEIKYLSLSKMMTANKEVNSGPPMRWDSIFFL